MITKRQLTCCSLRGRGGAGVLRVGVQVGVDVVGHLEAVSLRVSLHHHLPDKSKKNLVLFCKHYLSFKNGAYVCTGCFNSY